MQIVIIVVGTVISIHALLAESDVVSSAGTMGKSNISIHALLAESDGKVRVVEPGFANISIHALLAESDLGGMSDKLIGSVFLSTLSLRRATI